MGRADARADRQGACFRLALPGVDLEDGLPVPTLVCAHRQ